MRFSAFAAFVLGMAAMATAQNANWNYEGKTGPLRWASSTPRTEPAPTATSNRPSTFTALTSTRRSSPLSSTTLPAPSRLRTTAALSSSTSTPAAT